MRRSILFLLLLLVPSMAMARRVTLKWSPSQQPPAVRGYQVFRLLNNGSAFTLLAKVGTALRYVDRNAPSGAYVCYQIKAVGSTGLLSVASNTVCRQLP